MNGKLHPASWDEARKAILPLLDMKMGNDANNAEGMMAGIRASCHGEPLWAIQQTVFGFTTGRLGRFCPDGADFGIELRKLTDPLREQGARFERERRNAEALADEADNRGPMSDEARAAVERFLGKSRQVADEMREDMRRRPEPKTPRAGYGARVAEEVAARRAARSEA